MAQPGRRTTLEERVKIGQRAQAGQTDPEIAAGMDLSVWVVRKWRRMAKRTGRSGLSPRLGRPPTGALGAFPEEMVQAIQEMRQAHPGWGPVTVLTELEADPRFAHTRLPSRSRVAAFFKQAGLTRTYQRHSDLPQPRPQRLSQAHQEWEMDAQGVMQVAGLGRVSLIHIGDLFSRLKVDSLPCIDTSKPCTEDYQKGLRRGFWRYGLPDGIHVDHDSVFYDNTCPSPYPTSLHLWLIALGVDFHFGPKGRPTDRSVIERTHQTVTRQAVLGQEFGDGETFQQHLDERLDFLNGRYPSTALGGKPPLVAHPQAHHSGRCYYPEWEEAMLDPKRVYAYLAKGRWFRKVSLQGQCSLGAYRYGVGKAFAGQTIEITFDPNTQEFVCLSQDGCQTRRLPAQGLTKADWMGQHEPGVALPAYQLSLPFLSLPAG